MNMQDSRRIAAPPDVVWAALSDPDVLRASVPGCEELSGSAEDGFEAVVVQKVGPVKARFRGTVKVSETVAGESMTLTGEGKGGAAGFARGQARVELVPEEDGTRLSYSVESQVGGKLAQLGSRVIDGFARNMADAFFTRFQQAVEGPAPEAAAQDAAAPDAAAPEAGPARPGRGGWLKRITGRGSDHTLPPAPETGEDPK